MINNRQAGRRNRGRNNNNGRPGGQSRGGSDNGNRIDNRSRGNAAQLLEKYRNMARDAQLSGDRVNAEYYLQFADHYFRVLADNRARQEEAQGQQRQPQSQRPWDPESDGDDFDAVEGGNEFEDRNAYAQQGNGNRDGNRDGNREQVQREQGSRDNNNRREGYNRDSGRDNNRDSNRDNGRDANRENGRDNGRTDRQPYQPRREEVQAEAAPAPREEVAAAVAPEPRRGRGRPPRDRNVEPVQSEVAQPFEAEAPVATTEAEEAPRQRRGLRQRRPREEAVDHDEPVGIDLAVLPPAIARAEPAQADNDSVAEVAEEAPRKRTRRVRPAATEAAE